MQIHRDIVFISLPPTIASSTVATAGFVFWTRLRSGRFPLARQTLAQAVFTLTMGFLVSYNWALSRQRQRQSFTRMMQTTAGVHEIRYESSDTDPFVAPTQTSATESTSIPRGCINICFAGKFLVPASSVVTESDIAAHPLFVTPFDESSMAHWYGVSIRNSLNSLLETIHRGSAYQLDALYYAIRRYVSHVNIAASSSASRLKESQGGVFAEYAELIGISNTHVDPGINTKYGLADSLEGFAELFAANDGIIYVEDIFDVKTFSEIRQETNRLWLSDEIEANCNLDGRNRNGGYIHLQNSQEKWENDRSSLYSLVYANEPLRLWISAVTQAVVFPADFPMELREYGKGSRGMPCHSDLQMYDDSVSDFEVVVTIHNEGSFPVSWYTKDGTLQSVIPKGNSITIVKPGGAVHCVGGSRGGNREILKFIMVGGYTKGHDFNEYVGNTCYAGNRNVIELERKRKLGRTSREYDDDKEL